MKLALLAVLFAAFQLADLSQATPAPSFKPSKIPTAAPTLIPTRSPTTRPTGPTIAPTRKPTAYPSARPTNPSAEPTLRPTGKPSTLKPSNPTIAPTASTQSPTSPIGTIVSFPFTGDFQEFTVPNGVTSLEVTLVGASGATASFNGITSPGGRGAKITATVPVNTGEVYRIYVGGAGNVKVAGYNGGGEGKGNNPPFLFTSGRLP